MTRVVGTKGTLWADGDTVYIADDDEPAGRILESPAALALPDVDALAAGKLADMTLMELPPYIRLTQAFLRSIEGEPPAPGPQPATFRDGLACMRVISAVRQSAADNGRWITIGDLS
jgi:predicted dehydrogenase